MDQRKTGALIAAARKECGITQRELANQVGVSDRAVSNWERGIRFPDISLLEPLCSALHLTALELIRGEAMGEENLKTTDFTQSLTEALSAQKAELRRSWVRITFLCVLFTVLLCAGGKYAFLMDGVRLMNLPQVPRQIVGMAAYAAVGALLRYLISKDKVFCSVWLGVLTLWLLCETISAVIFQYDILGLVSLASVCAGGGWFFLWVLLGAMLAHLIVCLRRRGKRKHASAA